MSFLFQTRTYTKEEKRTAVADIIQSALPDSDFYILVIGAALFALCGIALDSIPVLIGAMIVAPLGAPILALGLGIVSLDMRLALRSATTLVVAALLAASAAALAASLLPPFSINGTFISFMAHPLYDIIIAIIAGVIAAYGHVRAKVGASVTGIGIAVSLMPPLVASALALGTGNALLFHESFVIFFLNVAGILAGSIIIFFAFGIRTD